MLDADRLYRYRLPHSLQKLRLKEWQSFTVGDDRWFIFVRLFDAKLMGSASLSIWDRKERRKYGFRRILNGLPILLPAHAETLYPSLRRYKSGRSGIEFRIDARSGAASALAFDVPSRGPSLTCRLDFDMKPGACAPYSACLPLSFSRAESLSRILMPARGELVIGDERFTLDETRAASLFDDGKAYFPLHHESDRLSGFGMDASGRRTGFWLTDPGDPGVLGSHGTASFTENRLLLGDRTWPLPPVRITQPYGPSHVWNIQDTEGMVDLVFTPETPNRFRMHLGIAVVDFHEPWGHFEGALRNGAGDKIDASALFGRGETQFMRI